VNPRKIAMLAPTTELEDLKEEEGGHIQRIKPKVLLDLFTAHRKLGNKVHKTLEIIFT
jgi:hypothetical protein